MASRLEIYLLGGFRLVYNGQTLDGFKPPRQQALLAYLVLHRHAPQSRQHLAYLLWPGTSENQAHTNIRKQLHFLRQALPEAEVFLRTEAGEIQWREGSPYSLDVTEFEAAIATGSLEKAVSSYTADLLPGCYDDWIVADRERLKQLYSEALERLIQQNEEAHDYAAAIYHAQCLLRSYPLREEIHRHLIRLHALNGDRAAALQAYINCATVLKRELDVEPSAITQEVYTLLLDHKDHLQPLLPLAGQFPLIGRSSEWARLQEAWRQAARGTPRMALITGEAGIGKTRLAEELLIWVDRQGITASGAHCYAAEGTMAYGPLTDWLRARPLPPLEPVWLAEVSRLLPELSHREPGMLHLGPLTEAWQRQRFHEALARAVLGLDLAEGNPLLLLIEDLQWCDRDTFEWLHYLLRFNQRARLLVMGSLRTEMDLTDHPLTSLLSDCRRQNILTEIDLKPLNLDETTSLGAQVFGRSLDDETASTLYAETEGNPLFILEFARANLIKPIKGKPRDTTLVLPPVVQAAITERIERLSQPVRDLVELAAVIGREFTFDVLYRASGADEKTVMQALDQLWRYRIIREQGQAAYDFSHDKLRQVVYEGIRHTRRRWLHRQVANTLVTLNASHPEPASGQIGWHYEQAGENQLASQWLWKAGEEATKTGSFANSLAFSQRALDLLSPDDPHRAELLYSLGMARIMAGEYDPALETLEQAYELAQKCGDPKTSGRILSGMSNVISRRGLNQKATGLAEAALTLAKQVNDQETIANVLRQLGSLAYYRKEFPQALVYLGESLSMLKTLGNLYDQARCLNSLGLTYMEKGDYAEALQYYGQAYEICITQHYRAILGQVVHNMGWTAFIQKDFPLARQYQDEAYAYAQEIGDHGTLCVILNALGHIALRQGDLSRAETYYRDGLSEAQFIRPTPVSLEALAGMAGVWAQTGAPVRAAELFGLAVKHPYTSPEVNHLVPFISQILGAALPPEILETAMERGQHLDLDQTVDETLKAFSERRSKGT